MHTLKFLLHLFEWILRYALLSPGERRLLAKRFKPRRPGGSPGADAGPEAWQGTARLRYHWVGEGFPALPQPEPMLPPLAPGLMHTITASVMTVTAFSLWIVSLGRVEALYNIPLFILIVLMAMFHWRAKKRRR